MLIRNFSLHTVELTEPVLENAFMKEQEYLRKLQCGRLLAGFRQVAGMDKKAEPYPGGWEDAELAVGDREDATWRIEISYCL